MVAVEPLPMPTGAPGVRIGYERIDPAQALARADTLAVIGFGTAPAAADDPRRVDVPLQVLHGPDDVLETWRVDGPVRHGRDGDLAWAQGGGYLLASLVVAEPDATAAGARTAAAQAYRQLIGALAAHGHPHLLRAWNYLTDINRGDGEQERYRHFTVGRAQGIHGLPAEHFPAATAIGRLDGPADLVVYALAAREPGRPVENPRQVSAYRYPRQYGPVPPSFARAMRVPTRPPTLLISGTASVVGHESVHDAVEPQARETLRNLDALVQAAGLGPRLDPARALLKAYVRHAADAPVLAAILADAGLPADRLLLLHGDICRADLLLEIDGTYA
jgi:chorismate lyase/3-hydroxybenzoate synthase